MDLFSRRRRRALTTIGTAVAAIISGLVIHLSGVGEHAEATSSWSVALIVLGGAAVAFRGRWPLVVLVVVSIAHVTVVALTSDDEAMVLVTGAVMYTIGRHRGHLPVASAVVVAVSTVAAVTLLADPITPTEAIDELAKVLLFLVAGGAMRVGASRAAERVDAEAAARVQAERLAIARDLHDIVAHGLSSIAVQSGVAAHVMDRDPVRGRVALEEINVAAKRALEELRGMVGALRSTDAVPSRRPTPTDPDDLSGVLAGARRSGLEVELLAEGDFPDHASEVTVIAAHRIIQESLTNVARHAGPVPVTVTLSHGADAVRLEIVNAPCPEIVNAPLRIGRSPVPSTGIGIVGMTERAVSLGGTLAAEPTPDGGFRVEATIPYHRPGS
jgi:signal transduction histidine kinase